MDDSWQSWCRLCATIPPPNTTGFPDFKKHHSEHSGLIQTCFKISMDESLHGSTPKICPDCTEFLVKLKSFEEICSRSEKLFRNILSLNISTSQLAEDWLINLRSIYLSEDEEDDLPLKIRIKALKKGRKPKQDKEKVVPEKRRLSSEYDREIDTSLFLSVEIKKEDNSYEEGFENQSLCSSTKSEVIEDEEVKVEQTEDLIVEKNNEEESRGEIKPKRGRKRISRAPLKCHLCGKILKNNNSMRSHMKMLHPEDPTLQFDCDQCPKKFPSKQYLAHHKKIHLPLEERKRHPCPYCDKLFFTPCTVSTHIQSIHIGLKPFICEECGMAFSLIGALNAHKLAHSDEKPVQCPHCPKRFKTAHRLRRHEDTHQGTEYICPECGLKLNTKRTLKNHMVVHSDVKQFKCQYCGNEFKRAKTLKDHLILHTGMHPYSCPFCDRTFAHASNCRSHKLKMHPVELAALEASGLEPQPVCLPRLDQLQPVQQETSPQ